CTTRFSTSPLATCTHALRQRSGSTVRQAFSTLRLPSQATLSLPRHWRVCLVLWTFARATIAAPFCPQPPTWSIYSSSCHQDRQEYTVTHMSGLITSRLGGRTMLTRRILLAIRLHGSNFRVTGTASTLASPYRILKSRLSMY